MNTSNVFLEKKPRVPRIMSGKVFLGCMFIGMGIGMLLDHTGAGLILGIGAGFLSSAIIEACRGSVGRLRYFSTIPIVLGIAFILWGLQELGLIVLPEISFTTITGIVLLAIGLALIAGALKIILSRS